MPAIQFSPQVNAIQWTGDNLEEIQPWVDANIPGATAIMDGDSLVYRPAGALFGTPLPIGNYIAVFMGGVSIQDPAGIASMGGPAI